MNDDDVRLKGRDAQHQSQNPRIKWSPPPICLLLCIPSLFTLLNIHTVMIKHISQSLTPDDQTFRALASLYATRHKSMFKGNGLCHDDNFPGGFIFFCILIFQNCSVQVVSQMVLNGTL